VGLRGATGATVPRSPAERTGNTITMSHYPRA
jgi:hypothetical protein